MYQELKLVGESSRSSASSGSFEFPALGSDVRFGCGSRSAWCFAEVFDGFSCLPRTHEENCFLSFRCSGSQLVQSDAFTSTSQDTGTSCSCESQSTHCQLRHLVLSPVVCDRPYHYSYLPLSSFLRHLSRQTPQRHWWPVHLAHEQSLQDYLVELRSSPPCQVSVQL